MFVWNSFVTWNWYRHFLFFNISSTNLKWKHHFYADKSWNYLLLNMAVWWGYISRMKKVEAVGGLVLFAHLGHLDFCAPSPNTHSWVKIKIEILSILTIAIRKIMHDCIIRNLINLNIEVQQEYISKKGLNLIIIWGFLFFCFLKRRTPEFICASY